jgi:FkbM family methyltransferase
MWCGAYEPETTKIFRSLLIKGGIVLDVGAHIGYFSLIAAALVGRTGEVHAFEPDPDCFAALCRNAASWSHVVPWNLAVAELSGTASLHRSAHQGESGWSSIVNGGDGAEGVEVCTVALDDWILDGAKRILFDHRPALVFEANEACLAADGRRVGDLIELARSIGYGVWQVFSARRRPTGTLLALHPRSRGNGGIGRLSHVRLVPQR